MERLVTAPDGQIVSRDVRYFVSSLDPGQVTPEELLQHVRKHWHIDNCLHFVKDRWWDEYRHWTKRPGLAERLSLLSSAALSVLRLLFGDSQLPLRRLTDRICWKPSLALAKLGYE